MRRRARPGKASSPRFVLAAMPVAVLAILLAACGEREEPAIPAQANEQGLQGDEQTAGEIRGDADPADARVIDEWATTLSSGDVDGAAEYFAIPSVAENGPILIRIRSPDEARAFNASLPCGARLIRAAAAGEFVVGTFRLGERPGPGECGSGTGATAQTAFVIADGEIVEWRRVGVGGEQAPSQSV